jgi:hypothetical protein
LQAIIDLQPHAEARGGTIRSPYPTHQVAVWTAIQKIIGHRLAVAARNVWGTVTTRYIRHRA